MIEKFTSNSVIWDLLRESVTVGSSVTLDWKGSGLNPTDVLDGDKNFLLQCL